MKSRLVELDLAVAEKIGNSIEDIGDALIGLFPQVPDDIFLPDAENGDHIPVDEADTLPEADDFTPEEYDKYLTAEVLLLNMGK